MSAVKIFALGVLMTGTLASSTLAGSIRSGQSSPTSVPGQATAAPTSLTFAQPVLAAQNLAGSSTGSGSSTGGDLTLGTISGGGSPQGGPLVLGTSQSTSPINFGGASFQVANSVAGATAPQSQPAMPLSPVSSGMGQANPPASQTTSSSAPADAFINFGSGPFPEASNLTTGNPQSFFKSPAFTSLFGSNGPSSQDLTRFETQVLSTVQNTYNAAGLPIHLTLDPSMPAAHTLSVVSGASNPQNPGAIGITDIGNNGFSFIDKFGAATNLTQLATAIGHNVAHELMHAFGLANHPETNGPYVDAASTTFSNLADPNTGFSPAAAALLSTLNFQATGQSITAGNGSQMIDGNQVLLPEASPVPEPSTIALWTLAGFLVVAHRRRQSA
jgi:hypothetical protein